MTVNPLESAPQIEPAAAQIEAAAAQIEPPAAQIEPPVPADKSNIAKTITNLKESATKGLQNLQEKISDTSSEFTNFTDTIKNEVQQRAPIQISAQNIIIVTYIISNWVIYNLLSALKPSILTDEKGELITFRVLVSSFLLNNLILGITLRTNPELVKRYLNLWK
tara:strand:- start:102 stop:596 length:495 start_codon:yes stop_codon:yes gene_type:complete